MSEVTDRVDAMIVEHLATDKAKVTPDASLIDDLLADSLDIIELAMMFEEEFHVQISDDEADSLHLVSDCHKMIEAKTAEKMAA